MALGLALQGRILIAQARHEEGCESLDEAMTLVVSGQLDDYFAGAVYCALIAQCREIADIRRGSQWTEAARRWCASLPATTPFHWICRIHRGEILCLRGAWEEAETEILAASDELAAFKPRSAAEAFAALGELCLRRGDLDRGEAAFRRAHELGGDPQPGLALLWLAQGRATSASLALRGALADMVMPPVRRVELLAAQVEVALRTGDVALAEAATRDLSSIAEQVDRPVAHARARLACGAVRLAGGDPGGAMVDLRAACTIWCELGLPYEEAQTRLLLAAAARDVGDLDSATLEIQAARAGFQRLGARTEVDRATALRAAGPRPAGLTAREVDVLRLLAAGMTNREIAAELLISEHTVGRHVQNLFTKLGVSSRAAATAYAVKHHLA